VSSPEFLASFSRLLHNGLPRYWALSPPTPPPPPNPPPPPSSPPPPPPQLYGRFSQCVLSSPHCVIIQVTKPVPGSSFFPRRHSGSPCYSELALAFRNFSIGIRPSLPRLIGFLSLPPPDSKLPPPGVDFPRDSYGVKPFHDLFHLYSFTLIGLFYLGRFSSTSQSSRWRFFPPLNSLPSLRPYPCSI